ncbi:WhiB family transcriptional regulator [Streptomyces mobaraensis]|uniref:WhiB family transcriptional regulator n=1 Tax=Streptomyces mobaraensis TaxID=35621 RepID=A0A5N5WD32_STRMB|nr:WhiB family transcriptional regulator [Streptomyces mobaraensis]KAB7850183.1 WhiB family transcriptional regulator [Streptomyces mobaraensis]
MTESWERLALCRRPDADPAWWHSVGNKGIRTARSWCARCPVAEQCLAYVMRMEEGTRHRYGVYGGLTGPERRQYADTGVRPAPNDTAGRTHGRPPSPCGTEAAYQRHLREHEPTDEACRRAHAAHVAHYRPAGSGRS